MISWSLATSAGHFWWPGKFKNMENLYIKNLKHLRKLVHLSLTAPNIFPGEYSDLRTNIL